MPGVAAGDIGHDRHLHAAFAAGLAQDHFVAETNQVSPHRIDPQHEAIGVVDVADVHRIEIPVIGGLC